MKYKILQLLFIYTIIAGVTSKAQTSLYPRPNTNSEIPFGKKQPPPPNIPGNEMHLTADQANENYFRKRNGLPEFDSATKRFRPFKAEKNFYNPVQPASLYQTLNRQGQKEKNFFKKFELTKDINQISDSYPANYGSYGGFYGPSSAFAISKNVSYFTAEDGIHGRELWRSDGTSKGTYLFKDLNPGEAASNPTGITSVNDKLFFNAFSASHGEELWVSDGTAAGTKMLVDVLPGPESSRPGQIVGVGNSVFFVTSPGNYYYYKAQLWRTDGSPQGTLLLLDFTSSENSSFISNPTKINNLLFFTVRSFTYLHGPSIHLWRSDGTREGTFAVKDFGRDFWGPMHFTAYNNKLYFSADDGTGRKLWMSDGTPAGSVPAPFDNGIGLTVYYNSSSWIPFQQIGHSLLIFGFPASGETGLYKYDASGSRGMELVSNLALPTGRPFAVQSEIVRVGGSVYFKLSRYSPSYSQHEELWRSDGTAANTRLVKAFLTGDNLYNFHPHNERIYFSSYNYINIQMGQEPWTSDGTAEGTLLLKDIFKGPESSYPSSFTSINGKLIFNARNETGFELWTTNGTEAGTTILKDINTHSTAGSGAGTSGGMAALGEKIIFDAYDGEHGQEIYVSDGSNKGTFLLKDINPRPWQSSYPNSFLSKNNYVYFLTSWYDHSRQVTAIYKTNGSTGGTSLVIDFGMIDRERTSVSTYKVAEDGTVYYIAYHSSSGTYSIWRSDGTVAGTYMLANNVYNSSNIAIVGKHAYFIGGNPDAGYELWKTDGSKTGTNMIKDIRPGSQGSYPYGLFTYKNDVYFGAYDGTDFYSFWKTDGTEKGTIKLKAITPENWLFTISNDMLYFSAIDYNAIPFQGSQLWKTNGSQEGTKIVRVINPNNSASPRYLTDVNGKLFFLADDGAHGFELWTTDGSASGTNMLTDITPQSGYPDLSTFTSAGGRLFFLKGGGCCKSQLWSSDGTAANTRPVIEDGLDKITMMYNLKGVGDKLFVSGSSYKYGAELYSAHIKDKVHRFNSVDVNAIPEENTAPLFAVTLFPNPAISFATLKLSSNYSNASVTITDITGKLVWEKSFSRILQINLPIEKLNAGLYTVTVKNNTDVKTIKLIKQ